jgi:hypothetical protein
LARGHALSHGRNHVTKEDLSILVNVAMSTAPAERVAIFNLLLANKGTLRTSDITKGLNTTPPTAKRTMVELAALGLVDLAREDKQNAEYQITLKADFSWFLTPEFEVLKENYTPRKGESKESGKQEDPSMGGGQISFSGDLPKEKHPPPKQRIFLEVFRALQKEADTVNREKLKQELVSSGKFDAGEAFQIIKENLETNTIFETLPLEYKEAQN